MDHKEIFEKFLNTEHDLALFTRQFHCFPYWSFLRQHVYNQICVQTGMAQSFAWVGDEATRHSAVHKVLICIKNLFSRHNPLFAKQCDVMFFHAPRKVKEGNGYISPLIDAFADQLPSTYCVVERSVTLTHIPYALPRTVYYHDLYDVLRICRYLLHRHDASCKGAIIAEIKPILDAFDEAYEIHISRDFITDRMFYAMLGYETLLPYYQRLLSRVQPKVVVEVCHYDVASFCMTAAAHDAGIPVAELQHGIFSPYNSAYNFASGCGDRRCLPDQIFCFGQYWKDTTRYPDKEKTLVLTGFAFFDLMKKNIEATAKLNGKRLLFVSSPKVADCLIDTALRLNELLPEDYQITYRLHPLEMQDWRQKYPQLAACSRIQVADTMERTIYDYFAQTDYQVGVSSLGIFEGIGFGVPAFILKRQDYLDAEALCEFGAARLVDSAEEIADALQRPTFVPITTEVREQLWKSSAAKNVVNALEQLIESRDNRV